MDFCCEMGVGLRTLDVCTRVPSMVFGCLNKCQLCRETMTKWSLARGGERFGRHGNYGFGKQVN